MRRLLALMVLSSTVTIPMPATAQKESLESLLRAHSYDMWLDNDTLAGPGREFLLDAAGGAQFVAIAEEHNVAELNAFAAALFEQLHQAHGFRYLALEQGSVITSWMGGAERRGDLDAIGRLAARYPNALAFATDDELRLLASAGNTSSAVGSPLWGVDQEFGALHILDRLALLAPGERARQEVERLAADAREHEADRSSERHYLSEVAGPGTFESLPTLFDAEPGSEASTLIEALARTLRIYQNHALSRQGQPTSYENGREREQSMKLRFMEQYRMAQENGDPLPRVLAKLGHWHVFRGFFRANVPTFGNFLSEFAISNGLETFILSTYVVDSPEEWRNASGPITAAAGDGAFTLVDLRPLRPLAHQNMVPELTDDMKRLLFVADAALLIRGGHTGSYDIVRRTSVPR